MRLTTAALHRWRALLVALGCWLGSTAHVSAQATASERGWASVIRVEAGASCLTQERLIEHVRAWFGGRVVATGFDVLVREGAGAPRAVRIALHNGDRSYQREFRATPDACVDRHAVIGLAIALAIDAELAASLSAAATPAPQRRRALDLELGASHGVLHTFGFGAQASGLLGLSSWCDLRADAFTQLWFRSAIEGSAGTFDAMLFAGSLQLQAGGEVGTHLRLGLAMGLAAGALHARGHGYAPNRNDTALWLALRVGVRLELRIPRAWALDLAAVAPLHRTQLRGGLGLWSPHGGGEPGRLAAPRRALAALLSPFCSESSKDRAAHGSYPP